MTIPQKEYALRRQQLMEMMEPNSIAIVSSSTEQCRSRDTDFPFRQDSDFAYLSGFTESESVLVLIPGREHGEYVLFCREKDKDKEIWDGYREGPEGAVANLHADDAFPIDDIDDILPGLIEGRKRVYYAMGKDTEFDRNVMEWVNSIRAKVRSGSTPPGEFLNLGYILHEMRLFKSDAEVHIMKTAAQISAAAHVEAMKQCKPGMYEYQLGAIIQYDCAMNGGREPAYNSIVGGGENACILHYVENDKQLNDGDLVLIDAGCEYHYYASDITRTFPINGKFSPEQRAIYQLVLDAQKAALSKVSTKHRWNEPHDASVQTLTAGLIELGLLNGELDELIAQGAYKEFYMHRIGHWIGMDVHDVGDYKVGGEWRLLEAGMVMTVEPGLYISPNNTDVDARWRGIGVRIEDDILITQNGYDVLSKDVPKEIDDIEALMAQA